MRQICKHLLWLSALLALAATGGCASSTVAPTAAKTPAPAAPSVSLSEVPNLAQKLGCEKSRLIEDDVYSMHAMKGLNCLLANGDRLYVRAFDGQVAAYQSLQDSATLVSDKQPALIGGNWYAIGPERALANLGEVLGADQPPTTNLPGVPPISPDQMRAQSCLSGLVTLIRSEVLPDTVGAPENPGSYEEVYPGIRAESRKLAAELNAAGAPADEADFEIKIAQHAAPLKAFCNQASLAAPHSKKRAATRG